MAWARSSSRSDALQPLLVKSFYTLYEQAWRQVSTSACACKSGPPRGTNPQSTGVWCLRCAAALLFLVVEAAILVFC